MDVFLLVVRDLVLAASGQVNGPDDQVAVDGYQDGVLSESQMADEFSQDASFDNFDDIINS